MCLFIEFGHIILQFSVSVLNCYLVKLLHYTKLQPNNMSFVMIYLTYWTIFLVTVEVTIIIIKYLSFNYCVVGIFHDS